MNLKNKSLGEVEYMYQKGMISEQETIEYIKLWNAGPCRFTQAILADGAIRQFDPERSGKFYQHLKDKFNLNL